MDPMWNNDDKLSLIHLWQASGHNPKLPECQEFEL